MSKNSEEWFVKAPWGNIACVSWGDPHQKPFLMLHGFMDTSASFIPIVKHLPEGYFYVALDLPGHGKSDAFPVGPLTCQGGQVEAVRFVVEHHKWDKFVFMAHSMGVIIGILYNAAYPFKIVKMINLDPLPPLCTYCFHEYSPEFWYQFQYGDYYENISQIEELRNKQYTYDQAIDLMVRYRKLTLELSEVVLSRSLIPVGDGKYRLSWEPSMKKVVGMPFTEDYLCEIMAANAPPTLFITASIKNVQFQTFKANGVRLLQKLKESMPDLIVREAVGNHDVHVTNPEACVSMITDFLNIDFQNIKSKL